MLLIKAKGGLGNRMLSAASAIAYAHATNRDWCLDWSDGVYAREHTNAAPLLFPSIERVGFSSQDWQHLTSVPSLWKGRLDSSIRDIISKDYPNQHSNPTIYRRLSAPFTSAQNHGTVEVFWSYTSKYGRVKRFLTPEQRKQGRDHILGHILRTHFKPSAAVIDSVEQLVSKNAANTLGVHIRYTDLKVPIHKLIVRVKAQMRKFDYDTIFLASDSLEAEVTFKKEFEKVITSNKQYAPDNTQLHVVGNDDSSLTGATSALIDMLALSKCAGLVYCSRSTFAETSRLFGAIDSKRVVDVDRFNALIRLKRMVQEYL